VPDMRGEFSTSVQRTPTHVRHCRDGLLGEGRPRCGPSRAETRSGKHAGSVCAVDCHGAELCRRLTSNCATADIRVVMLTAAFPLPQGAMETPAKQGFDTSRGGRCLCARCCFGRLRLDFVMLDLVLVHFGRSSRSRGGRGRCRSLGKRDGSEQRCNQSGS
jgi:hypothetical protein